MDNKEKLTYLRTIISGAKLIINMLVQEVDILIDSLEKLSNKINSINNSDEATKIYKIMSSTIPELKNKNNKINQLTYNIH